MVEWNCTPRKQGNMRSMSISTQILIPENGGFSKHALEQARPADLQDVLAFGALEELLASPTGHPWHPQGEYTLV